MSSETVSQLLIHMRSLPPIAAALARLQQELPNTLYYHTVEHTEDVLSEVLTFGDHDKLSYHELYLLSLAAAYHDIGFIYKSQQNEEICARVAEETLSQQPDLSAQDVGTVKQMILDTTLRSTEHGQKQIPSIPLSRYLLDADVSNIGREDFLQKAELVRKEASIGNQGLFYRGVLQLLDAHEWYSPAGQTLRQEQKGINRERLLQAFPDVFKNR